MAGSKTLFYLLSNAAAVTAIVGTNPKRIYPLRIPQTRDMPAISYRQITAVPTNQKDAVSGFDKVEFDVECFAKTYQDVETLGAAVRTALDNKTETGQGENVDNIRFVRDFDGFDDAAKLYNKTLQFRFFIKR